MPSTYTANLGVEKPGTGEQAGVWGVTANTSYDTIDRAIDGNLSIALSSSTYNLATQQGQSAAQGLNKLIIWTGTQTAQGSVNITPNTAQKLYFMQNKTGGGFPIVFQMGTGASFSLQPGYSAVLYTDGAGAGAAVLAALDSPQFTNVLVQGSLSYTTAQTITQPMTFQQPVTFQGSATHQGSAALSAVSITPPGYTSATNDVYYRTAGGTLAPLAIGAQGQVLSVLAGPVLGWSTPGLSVGTGIGGSIANALYFANASNVLAQDSRFTSVAGTGIGLGLVAGHTLHLGVNLTPEVWLDTNNSAAQYRQIVWASSGAPRWNLYSPALAETGGNVGSDLALLNYNDAASASRYVLYMTRSTGNLGIGPSGDLGARLSVLNDIGGQPCLVVRGAANQSSNLQNWQNSSATNLMAVDASGNLTVTGSATISNNLTVSGKITAPNSGFLQTQSNSGRLDLYGTVAGHPLGTIHIGAEPYNNPGVVRGSIVLENAAGGAVDNIPAGCARMYYRNSYFVIQFNYLGANYWLTVLLTGPPGGANWNITSSPVA
jgi:hypothetical protein